MVLFVNISETMVWVVNIQETMVWVYFISQIMAWNVMKTLVSYSCKIVLSNDKVIAEIL